MPRKKVYRMVNKTKKEVYHGVADDVGERVSKFHCAGKTKAIDHWDCCNDKIQVEVVSAHNKRAIASKTSHGLERTYQRKNFKNIRTAGI